MRKHFMIFRVRSFPDDTISLTDGYLDEGRCFLTVCLAIDFGFQIALCDLAVDQSAAAAGAVKLPLLSARFFPFAIQILISSLCYLPGMFCCSVMNVWLTF